MPQHGQRGGAEQIGKQPFLLVFGEDLIQDGSKLILNAGPGLGQGGSVTNQMLKATQERGSGHVGLPLAKAQHLSDDVSIPGIVLDRL